MTTKSKLFQAEAYGDNSTLTENGAISNKSTMSTLLDFFYHAPSRRNQDNSELFMEALTEDKELATKALFYIRDVRGGQGERETFRQGLRVLARYVPDLFKKVLPFVPEYGRWDDVLEFVTYKEVKTEVVNLVKTQLFRDVETERKSLLAKWMPSENTSSKKTVALAKAWREALGFSPAKYRKLLSKVRKGLSLVETKMSNNQWNSIDYEVVPSRAALRYKKAFRKHDEVGYAQFLADVSSGKKEIKASTLYPYDLVGSYISKYGYTTGSSDDMTVEQLWKALPNFADTDNNMLVVADVSGSMFDGGEPTPITVSVSLAIYLAERNKGLFKDQFITFTDRPEFITLQGENLLQKVKQVMSHTGYNTNFQLVFDKLLSLAIENNLPQSEMPTSIFVVSDMQFDSVPGNTLKNFDSVKQKFEKAGYTMPKFVFWNVASRQKETPVTKDEKGVYLVSGCSPSIFKNAVNSSAKTPYELMVEVLNSERYEPLRLALSK